MANEPGAVRREERSVHGTSPDPAVLDLPHSGDGAEWWWFHARLNDGDGDFGLVLRFLRHRTRRPDGTPLDSHAVAWYRSDTGPGTHAGESWIDEGCVELARALARGDGALDPRVREAVLGGLAPGRAPLPDRGLPRPVRVGGQRLDLDFGGVGRLTKDDGGAYVAEADGEHSGFRLRLAPEKPAVAQFPGGAGGRSGDGATRSYSVPRLVVEGTFRRGGCTARVRGRGRYERAFGGPWHLLEDGQRGPDPVWTWAGLRLDNGWDVTVADIGHTDAATGETTPHARGAVLSSPDGDRVEASATLRGSRPWTSLATLNTYDTGCDVEVPELDLRLRVRAWFPRQEARSLVFGSGMLEADADVEGTMAGRPVRGGGLLAVLPSNRIGDFERYITRVRDTTLEEIDHLYPETPDHGALAAVAGMEDRPGELDGLVVEDLHASLVRPMRHATDGLGRSWRSYVGTAAIELCGADSEPYRPLLAATELLHTGCLVVDDVEDRSPLRRGRPAVHTVFGDPTAVNAATAAYFAFDQVLRRVLPEDDRLRLRVYQTYLRALRCGHAGQAIDITGHRSAMDTAVATGDAEPVLRRVRVTHRLKTAAPVRAIAEIGALIAGADEERLRAMGDYFDAVGLAYQISDDVIDLRGVTVRDRDGRARPTKHTAEDLRAGKVTMPLAHAVALVPGPRMREMWRAVRDGDADEAAAAPIARELQDCGAVAACEDEARRLVDQAWKPLQDLVPCSWHSVIARALGVYAARRERE
ncbi:polyprenyl synthetase family protein [Actinorugispora endophytica]|uniref:Geranylgeranyl pyrophosphate synthase n=1 Tax=Actinorugispora endophytica TaxID=1605990 RepID=A0A4V6PWW9_9ACTN|nr:polyprenyl synthetase family protein [Actinorugispora endophytica]TDQ54369.1 geranylgeranyl pyrophosphate synthase [Actinorugispora endophytica]